MKKSLFLIFFSCFFLVKTNFAQNAASTPSSSSTVNEALAASPDLGVIDVSNLTKVNGKHFFKAKVKNYSSTQVALNVQVKYKIGTNPWATLPPVLLNLGQLQTLTTGNIPTTGISGLVSGQTYTLQVCTIDTQITGNNCKVKSVVAP